MQPEQIFQEAERAASALASESWPDAAVERLRSDCIAFFDQVPAPPLYRRAEDPARDAARALVDRGRELYARVAAASRTGEHGKTLAPLLAALKAYLTSLCHVAEGRLDLAEAAYAEAQDLDRAANRAARLWTSSEDVAAPVFDRPSGRSRYDPKEKSRVEVKLVCPNPSCRASADYGFSPDESPKRVQCARCRLDFEAYLAFVRSVRRDHGRWQFKLDEPSGGTSRLEFSDASGAELSVARRDFLAFLYQPQKQLKGVLNLSTGRVLWIHSGACFLATAAFGEGARELDSFRAFRDGVLLRSSAGALLVRAYYGVGPGTARWVSQRAWAMALARAALRPVHRMLWRRGF